MSDVELTNLCAEAMGWKHLGAVGVELREDERRGSIADARYPGKLWCLSGGNDWWIDPEGHSVCGPCCGIPDPLRNDSDAMALVKRLELWIQPPRQGHLSATPSDKWFVAHSAGGGDSKNANLNRAIVECVAKLQKAK